MDMYSTNFCLAFGFVYTKVRPILTSAAIRVPLTLQVSDFFLDSLFMNSWYRESSAVMWLSITLQLEVYRLDFQSPNMLLNRFFEFKEPLVAHLFVVA